MTHPTPKADESERALLGGLLVDPDRLGAVLAEIGPDDMHSSRHAELLRLLTHMARERRQIDMVTVPEAICATQTADRYGGISYVLGLPDHCPSTAALPAYTEEVRLASVRRAVLAAALHVAEQASHGQPTDAAVSKLASASARLAGRSADGVTIGDAGAAELEAMHREAQGESPAALASPWPSLDDLTGGLAPGGFTIVGARPSMGKTALALNLALALAGEGVGVGVISLEMRRGALTRRCHSALGGVTMHRVMRPRELDQRDWDRLVEAQEQLDGLPIQINDTPGLTAAQICSQMLAWSTMGVQLVVIDHLGEIALDHRERRDIAVGQASKMIKDMGGQLGMHVVLLQQLNRSVEKRENKRPNPSDLRDSGNIEEQADTVIFVYRDAYYAPETADPYAMEAIVAKCRQGARGTAHLHWHGAYQRVTDPTADVLGLEAPHAAK